jgi:hypothetical protein
MEELRFLLNKEGFECSRMIEGGFIVDIENRNISIGLIDGAFSLYVQESFEYGPEFKSMDGLTKQEVLDYCRGSWPKNSTTPDVTSDRPSIV